MANVLCLLSPVSCAAKSVAKATLGDLFGALVNWVVGSVTWLLSAAGSALDGPGSPHAVAFAASGEFGALLVVAPILLLLGLLVATLAALRHGDSGALWRTYLGVAPACVAGVFLARPVASLVLAGVDQLSGVAGAGVGARAGTLGRDLLAMPSTIPGFGLLLMALAVIVGSIVLWCELVVRGVVLALLLVLVPVVVPLSAFPSLRRAGWRLAETFLAVAASKFLIVIVLALGLRELTAGGATDVITGAVTLLLATATPFVLLRLIPVVEASALHSLEGLRQRATRAVTSAPSSPAARAAMALVPDAPLPGPPERPEDLGIPTALGDGDIPLPPTGGAPPRPPVGPRPPRPGHVVYGEDEGGPFVGWKFDE